MDYTILATGASIASLITAIVAIVNVNRAKKVEYQYNYKKYILEKRIKIYEQIELVLSEKILNREAYGRVYNSLKQPEADRAFLKELSANFFSLWQGALWASPELLEKLYCLIGVFQYSANLTTDQEKELKDALLMFRGHAIELVRQYFQDLKNLDNITSFKKSKLKELKTEYNEIWKKPKKNDYRAASE